MSDEKKPSPSLSSLITHHLSLNQLCRRAEQPAHGRGRVGLAEDGRAGDENLGSGGRPAGDVLGADSAVYLYARREAALFNHAAQPSDLFERRRDELLPAEARVDRHHEHVVRVLKRLFDGAQTGRGGYDYSHLRALLFDCRQSPVNVRVGLDVYGTHLRARLDELL